MPEGRIRIGSAYPKWILVAEQLNFNGKYGKDEKIANLLLDFW